MTKICTDLWHATLKSGTRFGVLLTKARERVGMTQGQLAEQARMTIAAVSQIECGRREPSLDMALRLCRALDGGER